MARIRKHLGEVERVLGKHHNARGDAFPRPLGRLNPSESAQEWFRGPQGPGPQHSEHGVDGKGESLARLTSVPRSEGLIWLLSGCRADPGSSPCRRDRCRTQGRRRGEDLGQGGHRVPWLDGGGEIGGGRILPPADHQEQWPRGAKIQAHRDGELRGVAIQQVRREGRA